MDTSTQIDQYQKRIPIFPRSVKGRFRNLKYSILGLAYGIYFLLPWLRWVRPNEPDQAVLFDLAGRRFYLFGLTVHATDIFWLAGVLVIFALLLFMVTGIAGRVFCGYFCFQTLWTDVFILIERLVQGERNARMRLAKAPWGLAKLLRIGGTHLLWLSVAFLTGLTFTLYWENAPTLVVEFFTGQAPFPAYATTAFLTATTYVMAGLAREQVCTYMCPYARFQSVMFDRDTLIIAYDPERGERSAGRQKPRKGLMKRDERQAQGVGDCIDCGYCVQVCPTGIDIRNGLQYQCISCGLCVDACDTIMDSIGFPRGLVRYSSESELEGKRTRIFKFKTLGYGLALLATTGLLVWSIAHRSAAEMTVRQVRQPLAVVLSDGWIQNRYEIKVHNKTGLPIQYRLDIADLPSGELDAGPLREFEVGPDQVVQLVARVKANPAAATGTQQEFHFVVTPVSGKGEAMRWESVFYVPEERLEHARGEHEG